MGSVIRSLMVKVGADLSEFDKSLKKMSKDLKKTGKELSSAGESLTKGLTLPIVGAVAGLTSMAISAGKGADELITLSNKTGITTQALQEMEYAARFIDVEVETMTGSMAKLTKSMDGAQKGTEDQVEAFAKLGVEYQNSDGSLRNAKDVWVESIDALGKVANEADRDALSMRLFGKSAMELNPLIKAGSTELKRLGEEAHTVGAVMSDENVAALGKFDDQMQKLQAVVAMAGAELGAAFLPVLQSLMPVIEEQIVPAIQNFAGFITKLIDGFNNLSPGMQGFVLALAGVIIAIGPVVSVIGTLVTTVGGIVAAFGAASAVITAGGGFMAALTVLLGPVGIAIAAIAALAAIAFVVIKSWEPISEFFITLWDNVKTIFTTTWEAISLFFTETIPKIIENIYNFFMELPFKIGYALGFALGTIIKWGADAIDWAITNVPTIIKNVVDFFIELPEKITSAIVGGITALGTWASNLITKSQEVMPGVITNVLEFFKTLPGELLDIGKNLVEGLWNGINEKVGWLKDKIKSFASGIVAGIKSAMKINSPSKVMADQVGQWIPAGIAEGIIDNKKIVDNAMLGLSNNMSLSADSGSLASSDRLAGGGTANIIVELDGYTIARAMGQPFADMIRVKTGLRI